MVMSNFVHDLMLNDYYFSIAIFLGHHGLIEMIFSCHPMVKMIFNSIQHDGSFLIAIQWWSSILDAI
jgi:hypothetical protein